MCLTPQMVLVLQTTLLQTGVSGTSKEAALNVLHVYGGARSPTTEVSYSNKGEQYALYAGFIVSYSGIYGRNIVKIRAQNPNLQELSVTILAEHCVNEKFQLTETSKRPSSTDKTFLEWWFFNKSKSLPYKISLSWIPDQNHQFWPVPAEQKFLCNTATICKHDSPLFFMQRCCLSQMKQSLFNQLSLK